jgi:hypothetical protein
METIFESNVTSKDQNKSFKSNFIFSGLTSDSSQFNFKLYPNETKLIIDFNKNISYTTTTEFVVTNDINKNESKIEINNGYFNEPRLINVNNSSVINITNNNNYATIQCSDFDLSGVQVGDYLIFHDIVTSNIASANKGVPFLVTGIKGTSVHISATGVANQSAPIGDSGGISIYSSNGAQKDDVIHIQGGFNTSNQKHYRVKLGTDKYIITEQLAIEETVLGVEDSEILILDTAINLIFIKSTRNCDLLINGQRTSIISSGNENNIFSISTICGKLQIENKSLYNNIVDVFYSTITYNTNNC